MHNFLALRFEFGNTLHNSHNAEGIDLSHGSGQRSVRLCGVVGHCHLYLHKNYKRAPQAVGEHDQQVTRFEQAHAILQALSLLSLLSILLAGQ